MAKKVVPTSFPKLIEINNKTIGETIKAQRTSLDLSQQDAADLCGVNIHALRNAEKGAEKVTLKNILKIFMGLGIKIELKGLLSETNNM